MVLPDRIGPYKILREIGRGGMAIVYLAEHRATHEQVALKVLPRQFTFDPEFLDRFRREAQTARKLNHPAIAAVLDHGDDDDQPYIAMRYMPGGTLADLMQRSKLSNARVKEIVRQIASALDHIHEAGLIHRDLKPNNILFDEHHNAYLADFGVAKMTLSSAALTSATYVGTPAYMSPEQATARGDVDVRSDVYGLGVIVFEMLTGRPPYTADTPFGLSLAHLNDPIPQISPLRPELGRAGDGVMRMALAKRPQDRYETAGRLARAIDQLLSGETVEELAVMPLEPMPTLLEPRPALAPVSRAWLFGSAGAAVMAMALSLAALAGTVLGLPWERTPGGTPVYAPAVMDLNNLGMAREHVLASATWTSTPTATDTTTATATPTSWPSVTALPPTATIVWQPPTATAPPVEPTQPPPAAPANTTVPPTAVPPTAVPVVATATPAVATQATLQASPTSPITKASATPIVPSAVPSATAIPATATPVPPTATPVPPTFTAEPLPTDIIDPPIDGCPPKPYLCP